MVKNNIRFFSYFAIPNLTILLVVMYGISSLLLPVLQPDIGRVTLESVFEGRYLDIVIAPFRLDGHPIFIALALYITWSFGSWLEGEMGNTAYSWYVYTGYFLIMVGGLLFPLYINGWFLQLSLFFALAYINPNEQIYFFFVIPMKMWIMAVILSAFALYPPVAILIQTGSPTGFIAPLFAYGNFLLFFGPRFLKERKSGAVSRQRFREFKAVASKPVTIHKCHICGKTEADDPEMDFRYCAQCEGDYEYCMDHLHSHEHIKQQN